MAATNHLTTIKFSDVRIGDNLRLASGLTGIVVGLPDWEWVNDGDRDVLVGTIDFENFGAFVTADDSVRVAR